ncbi:MAG: HAD family phosphatase [Actinomycetota bacterium]|nr:HAD family phosphatase [Actinomycetota bacterium]
MNRPTEPPVTGLPAAVLWDLDGTLVDTEPSWLAAELALARRHGGTWSEADGLALVGNDMIASGRYIRDRMGLPLTPEQIVDELFDDMVAIVETGVVARPGALELLGELRSLHIPCALVTMSYRRMVEPIVAQLAPTAFDALVTGDEVAQGKPHPEAYLTAARLLGVAPERCIAIEDSVTGATSAQAAGARVVVVPNRVEVPAVPGRTVLATLERLRVVDLVAAAASAAGEAPVNIRGR